MRPAEERAPRREDGTRTFKLIEGGPLDTSFGKDRYVEIFENGGERRTTAKAGVALTSNGHAVANRPDGEAVPGEERASITSTRQ